MKRIPLTNILLDPHGCSVVTLVSRLKKLDPEASVADIRKWIGHKIRTGIYIKRNGRIFKRRTLKVKVLEILPNRPRWIGFWVIVRKLNPDHPEAVKKALYALRKEKKAKGKGVRKWSR